MSIKTRLALLLGFLLIVFGVTGLTLQRADREESANMLASLRTEQNDLLDRLIGLTGQPLQNFASDYSLWDEMVIFVEKRDPEWAKINLTASLSNLNANAAWVLQPDGKLVFGTVRDLDEKLQTPPFPTDRIAALLTQRRFMRFFAETDQVLLEVRAAPIQPSSDTKREAAPAGWLLTAKSWNRSYLDTFANLMQSEVTLAAPEAAARSIDNATGIELTRELTDWEGRSVRQLRIYSHSAQLEHAIEENRYDMVIFIAFGTGIIVFTFVAVMFWIVRPLKGLEHSLTTGTMAPLEPLLASKTEFGRLARLVEDSFKQRAALRESREELQQSTTLRVQLARDLHDGVIQSIYATGLGLESARDTMPADPAAAEARLRAAQTSLNDTIRQIRRFILDLEPEPQSGATLAESLRVLTGTLQKLNPLPIRLELDEVAVNELNSLEALHTLQIVREAISNATRHGNGRHINVRFRKLADKPELRVEDDGCGFDRPAVAERGSGLRNMASRAREMGAVLEIDTAPGRGTRLILRYRTATFV